MGLTPPQALLSCLIMLARRGKIELLL